MSDAVRSRPQSRSAANRQQPAPAQRTAAPPAPRRVAELKVSGHLMTLDEGLFCVVLTNPQLGTSGLPGVRLSRSPGTRGTEGLEISTFRDDGWLGGEENAALVRVSGGSVPMLVTIYQAPEATPDQAPRLQVMRLNNSTAPVPAREPAAEQTDADVVAHIQRTGDMGTKLGEWMGTRGSRLWIEGFGISPHDAIAPADIEYQAVLGRDWLSPWVEGGKFCGSRGMALPLLGLAARLKGAAAATHELTYSASFVDGSTTGPLKAGEPCQAPSLAALEAFKIELQPKGAARTTRPEPTRGPASKTAARPRKGSRT